MLGFRPCATMLGISGWSLGYQSAGPKSSRICAGVKAELLPARCSGVVPTGAGAGAGSGVAPGPGGARKPYAHGGGGSAAFSCCGDAPVAATRKTASIKVHMPPLLELYLAPQLQPQRVLPGSMGRRDTAFPQAHLRSSVMVSLLSAGWQQSVRY